MRKLQIGLLLLVVSFFSLSAAGAGEWTTGTMELFEKESVKEFSTYKTISDAERKKLVAVKDFNELKLLMQTWQTKGVSLRTVNGFLGGLGFWNRPSWIKKPETTIKHDLSIEGGLCAWVLEQLLDCNFPPVTPQTPKETIAAIQKEALERINTLYAEGFVAEDTKQYVDLSQHNHIERGNLARTSDTQRHTLSKLAKDTDREVRRTVAANPNTPYATLKVLSNDADPSVSEAAKNSEPIRGAYLEYPGMEFLRKKKSAHK